MRARVAVSREVSRGQRWIRAVKGCYVAVAILLGLLFMAMLLGGGASPGALVLVGLLLSYAVLGVWFVERSPVQWTMTAAVVTTVVLATSVFVAFATHSPGDLRAWRGLAGSVVLAAGFWCAALWARRYAAALLSRPDLIAARRVSGSRVEVDVAGIGTRHRDAARRDELAARRRLWTRLAVGVVSFVGIVVLLTRLAGTSGTEPVREPGPRASVSVDATLAAFEAAWNGNRVEDVRGHFLASKRGVFTRALDKGIERRKWGRLPTLAKSRQTDEGHFAAAWFRVAGETTEFYTSWAFDEAGRRWEMNLFRLP